MTNTTTPNLPLNKISVTVKEAVLFCTYEHPQITLLECLVCKLHLVECCLNCKVKGIHESECLVIKGVCEHIFHAHCIESWGRQRRECPACFKEWIPAAYVERT